MPAASDATVPRPAERIDPALSRRIASGVLLVAVAVADLWVGGWLFTLSVIGVVVLMADEWARLATDLAPRGRALVRVASALAAAAAALATMLLDVSAGALALALGAVLAAGLAATLESGGISRAAAGACYLGLPAVALIWLRGGPSDSLMPLLWLFLVVWATDIAAYFVGRGVGGAKLAPRISPGKTWAGLIGGMLGAALVGAAVSAWSGGPVWLGMLAAPVLAVVAQAGDLFESFLKRRAGVKDSGSLIPGHGGALDRLDGLLFAAPAYALMVGFGGRVVP
jgi:phosphatidate cytidylyltransferase